MNIRLSPELESFVRDQIAVGQFASADEVVDAALHRLQAAFNFRQAVQAGIEELDRGEGVLYTPEVLERITDVALKADRSSRGVDKKEPRLAGLECSSG